MGWSWFGLLIVVVLAWALFTGKLTMIQTLFWGAVLLIGLPLVIFIGIIIFAVIIAVIATIFE